MKETNISSLFPKKNGELAIYHLDEQKINTELRNNYFLRYPR